MCINHEAYKEILNMNQKLLILLIAFFLMTACANQSQVKSLSFDPVNRLYTSDKVGYPISELPVVLDSLLAKSKPIILFVHGRGEEPNKSLRLEGGIFVEGRAVHKLESGYDANVLMFNWDSERGSGFKDRGRPLSNMPAASQAFTQLLEGIKQYRKNNPQSLSIALIVHSMGNIVIETIIESQGGWIDNGGEPLFSNVVFSTSDADDIGHAAWVEKISASENVFITVNADDKILIKSRDKRPVGAAALGLEPGNRLANNATYIDITNLGTKKGKKTERHELFNKPGMHDQLYVCEFFQQALTGLPVLLNAQNSTEVVSGQRYKLNYKRDSTNDCFK